MHVRELGLTGETNRSTEFTWCSESHGLRMYAILDCAQPLEGSEELPFYSTALASVPHLLGCGCSAGPGRFPRQYILTDVLSSSGTQNVFSLFLVLAGDSCP